jgi:plasmid stabilization system protein ParE
MPKQIIWSPLAENDFNSILDYLQKNWDDKVVLDFVEITERLIAQISINPKQFPLIDKVKNVRKCVLTKHNTLFYRDIQENINVLRLFDNRQDPRKIEFN